MKMAELLPLRVYPFTLNFAVLANGLGTLSISCIPVTWGAFDLSESET